ncbi:hypothetical protein MMC09_006404 [Bachmanniomyces sp. S44760]|nr:hypothetical protein [Bachmanniomyces sp. S44760]
MSVGFGFSVGDFIAAVNLIRISIEAVQDSKGATNSFRSLLDELQSLESGLEAIDELCDLEVGSKRHAAITHAVVQCQACIEDFLARTAKYQKWIRPGAPMGWQSSLRKIQWALCKKADIDDFRMQLERHASTINMLLITLQISQTGNVTDMVRGLSCDQQEMFRDLLRTNQQLVQEIAQLRMTVQLQRDLPPQVLLQRPVVLLDACGRFAPFHLEFITSAEALLAVLKVRFKQAGITPRGLEKLEKSEFVLQHRDRRLSLTDQPWEALFRPGQHVDMSMIFRFFTPLDTCPSCQYGNEGSNDSQTECGRCGLLYQRIVDTEGSEKPPETSQTYQEFDAMGDAIDSPPPAYTRVKEYLAADQKNVSPNIPAEPEEVDEFRRVHILSPQRTTIETIAERGIVQEMMQRIKTEASQGQLHTGARWLTDTDNHTLPKTLRLQWALNAAMCTRQLSPSYPSRSRKDLCFALAFVLMELCLRQRLTSLRNTFAIPDATCVVSLAYGFAQAEWGMPYVAAVQACLSAATGEGRYSEQTHVLVSGLIEKVLVLDTQERKQAKAKHFLLDSRQGDNSQLMNEEFFGLKYIPD